MLTTRGVSSRRVRDLAAEVNGVLGAGAVRMGSDPEFVVTYIPTGCLPVDHLLQGGLPRGRFTEIYGDYSTLKSYIGLCAIAQVQRSGGVAALIDTEHVYDPEWAASIGVKTDELLLPPTNTGEEAMDAAEMLLRQDADLIVFDSIAATLPKAEAGQRMGGDKNLQPARLAALMSAACRKLTAANGKTAMLWINQTRLNVGVTFGSPIAIPGGKAMSFYASYRICFQKAGKLTRDTKAYDGKAMRTVKETRGQIIRATVEKSKLNRPHRETYFTFDLDAATVDSYGFLLNLGIEQGVVLKDGRGYLCLKGEKKMRESSFRGEISERRLASLVGISLGPAPAKTRRGLPPLAKKRAASLRRRS